MKVKKEQTNKESREPVSLITGKPCSWEQRCKELEALIFKVRVLRNAAEDFEQVIYNKIKNTVDVDIFDQKEEQK